MAVERVTRWRAKVADRFDIEAYADGGFVVVAQGDVTLQFRKREAQDVIDAIRASADVASEEEEVPF